MPKCKWVAYTLHPDGTPNILNPFYCVKWKVPFMLDHVTMDNFCNKGEEGERQCGTESADQGD